MRKGSTVGHCWSTETTYSLLGTRGEAGVGSIARPKRLKLILRQSLIKTSRLHITNASHGSSTNCYTTVSCIAICTDCCITICTGTRWPLQSYSPICVFCKGDEETLLRMSWGCPKIQGYWFDAQLWLHTNFTHCTDIIFSFFSLSSLRKVSRRPKYFNTMWCYCCLYLLCMIFSKELVTLGNKVNMVTHRILNILVDKYNISTSKLHGTIPHINGCIR